MIMRDASNRAVSISTDPDVTARARSVRHQAPCVDRAAAGPVAIYALIAWGLLERIRSHRERARLTIAELAVRCEPRRRPPVARRSGQGQRLARSAGAHRALSARSTSPTSCRPESIGRGVMDTLAGQPGTLTPLFGDRATLSHLMHAHVLEIGAGDVRQDIRAGADPFAALELDHAGGQDFVRVH